MMSRDNQNIGLPIDGFNPECLHKPKVINDGILNKVDNMIKENVLLSIESIDQREPYHKIEGKFVGLDSFGNIILEYNEMKTITNQPSNTQNQQKQPQNQQKPQSIQQRQQQNQQRTSKQQKPPPNQQKPQPKPAIEQKLEKSFYVIKLSSVSKIEIIQKKNDSKE